LIQIKVRGDNAGTLISRIAGDEVRESRDFAEYAPALLPRLLGLHTEAWRAWWARLRRPVCWASPIIRKSRDRRAEFEQTAAIGAV